MAKRVRYTYSKHQFPTIFQTREAVRVGRERARSQLKADLGYPPNIVKETDTQSQWVFIVEGRAT